MNISEKYKKDNLIDYINNLEIKIPKFSEEELYNNFCKNFEKQSKTNKPIRYFGRIKKYMYVNMLRHKYTDYDKILAKIYKTKTPGVRKAKNLLRIKILDKIAEVYPELKFSCDKSKSGFN